MLAARAQHLNFVGQENARKETFGARSRTSSISRLPLLGPVRHRHPQSSSHLSRVLHLCISNCSHPLVVANRVSKAFHCRQRSKPTVASRPNVASRPYDLHILDLRSGPFSADNAPPTTFIYSYRLPGNPTHLLRQPSDCAWSSRTFLA